MLSESLNKSLETVKDHKQVITVIENKIVMFEKIVKIENEDKTANVIPTRDGRRIHSSVKETSMNLQELGVAEGNVGPDKERVITTLTDTKNRLTDHCLPKAQSSE